MSLYIKNVEILFDKSQTSVFSGYHWDSNAEMWYCYGSLQGEGSQTVFFRGLLVIYCNLGPIHNLSLRNLIFISINKVEATKINISLKRNQKTNLLTENDKYNCDRSKNVCLWPYMAQTLLIARLLWTVPEYSWN